MDVSRLLANLNDAQREAVTAPAQPTLVLAGAGSGKTRVLVNRIGWLCRVEAVSPYSILAVTFTNKAAQEMRARVAELLDVSVKGMWVGTFHGLAHRLLRTHWREAGLPQSFQILDSDDQLRLVRRVLKGLELDESRWPARQAQYYINARKDEGLRPGALPDQGDFVSRQLTRIYTVYEGVCARTGLLDFAELLLRSLELLRHDTDLLAHYRQRFRHILVDEFQDTNAIQYAWLKQLAGHQIPLFAVGDDDQSIYGWRGARIENIHSFSQDYPHAQVHRLEQNYRSTGTILAAANGLIAHNADRLGKQLWTSGVEGEPIAVFAAYNEQDEARFVIDQLKVWAGLGRSLREAAVLYRSNAQSRVIEELLVAQRIPYRVYGGVRFFERAEIKDALAYLRLLVNPHDDAAFERIINLPPRGIGERTVATLRTHARQTEQSLWATALEQVQTDDLSGRAAASITGFQRLLAMLAATLKDQPLAEQIAQAIEHSGLKTYYSREGGEKAQARLENLDELINAARGFNLEREAAVEDFSVPTIATSDASAVHRQDWRELESFLAHAVLESGEAEAPAFENGVQLMTLHAAKGLEFALVFIVGLEEGLFPHGLSLAESGRLEEERRLCYVGITRARERLVLSFAESRRYHGTTSYNAPSRFIGELPAALLAEVRPQVLLKQPVFQPHARSGPETIAERSFRIGQPVLHAKFGEGTILACEGGGRHARVQVNFKHAGSKWLIVEYANLQVR